MNKNISQRTQKLIEVAEKNKQNLIQNDKKQIQNIENMAFIDYLFDKLINALPTNENNFRQLMLRQTL